MGEEEKKNEAEAGRVVVEDHKKSLDYVFENIVGGGSWYQWTTLLIMLPLNMANGFPLMASAYNKIMTFYNKNIFYLSGHAPEQISLYEEILVY